MENRLIKKEEIIAVKKLWAYCFEGEEDPFYQWYFSKYFNYKNTLGGFQDNKLMTSLQLIPYNIFLRGQITPVSYIVGVATYPEARGQGGIKSLMQKAYEEMNHRKHYLSLLMPFKAGFYYPYGYEICYHQYKYNLSLEQLKYISQNRGDFYPIKDFHDIDSINQLAQVYREYTKDKHGYVVRNSLNWQNLLEAQLNEKGYVYLLEKDEQACGYIFYFLRDNYILVNEIAYTSWEAQQSLLRFMYNHRSQVENLELHTSLDDLIFLQLPNPKKGVELDPFLMARIINAVKILENINYPVGIKGKIIISLSDSLAPWNEGIWELEINNSRGKMKKVNISASQAEIHCSIGALTQLVLGRVGAKELNKIGKVSIKDTERLKFMEEIFPCCNNYINEYY